jgi:hypothetical protein
MRDACGRVPRGDEMDKSARPAPAGDRLRTRE